MDNFDGALSVLEQEAQRQQQEQERLRAIQADKDHVNRWHERIKRAKKHDEAAYKQWAADRKYAAGNTNFDVDTNLIGAIMEVLSAFLYARDPQMIARPSHSVTDRHRQNYKHFARTLEIVVTRLLAQARLKAVAKRWVRGAMTVGIGWVKGAMQTRIEKDPIIEKQINDLQEQLENIDAKRAMIEAGDPDEEILRSEIESNLQAAQEKLERVLADGLVLDFIHPEDVTVAPECGEIENYLSAPWISIDSYKSEEQVLAITGWTEKDDVEQLAFANRYMQRPRSGEPGESGEGFVQTQKGREEDEGPEAESAEGFICVREIWSLEDGVVYTIIDGIKDRWARERYVPFTGSRFYPVFQLAFHYVDGERYPQSDVRQLRKLQDEYASIRSDYKKHRERARPGIIFDKTAIAEESVADLMKATTQEFIGIELVYSDRDISSVFRPKNYNQVDPGLYDTSPITRDIEKMSGVQDALQSNVQVEKTATEARIQETGFGARTGARRDQLEDVLTDLCEYVAQLALQIFDQAQVEKYAGQNAVWIKMNTDQVMTLFDIEIKAGSTGKPRKDQDREAWIQLLPLVKEVMERIGQAKLSGAEWAVAPWKALLRETFSRLDDHADLEDFVPQIPPEVIQQMQQGQKDPVEESKARLNEAKTVSEAADAVETLPILGEVPKVKELLGIPDESQQIQQVMQALQQGQQGQQPAPPEPIE